MIDRKIHLQLSDAELDALLLVLHDADINTIQSRSAALQAKVDSLKKAIDACEAEQRSRSELAAFKLWQRKKAFFQKKAQQKWRPLKVYSDKPMP